MFGGRSLAPISSPRRPGLAQRQGAAHLPQRAVQRREDPQALLPVAEQPLHELEARRRVAGGEGVAQQVEGLAQPAPEHRADVLRRDVLAPPGEGLELVHLAHQAPQVLAHLVEQLVEGVGGEAQPAPPQLVLHVRAQGAALLRRGVVHRGRGAGASSRGGAAGRASPRGARASRPGAGSSA